MFILIVIDKLEYICIGENENVVICFNSVLWKGFFLDFVDGLIVEEWWLFCVLVEYFYFWSMVYVSWRSW